MNAAGFFGLRDEIGTIGAGKIADLVLLSANPLENISNTRKIAGVILNGKHLSRSDLSKALSHAKEQLRIGDHRKTDKTN